MEQLQVFKNSEFGEIKVLAEGGEELFHATDCAKVLGYSNPQKAIRDHCKGITVRSLPTKGGKQNVRLIPEGDLYRLIIRSNLPTAERFEKWVFDEVLPSIRKYGMYPTPYTVDEMLADPDTMIRILQAFKKEREKRLAAEEKIKRLIEAKHEKRTGDHRKVLTFKEATDYLRIGKDTMYKLINSDEVKGFKIGRKRFFTEEELQQFIKRQSD